MNIYQYIKLCHIYIIKPNYHIYLFIAQMFAKLLTSLAPCGLERLKYVQM